jgi:hypothetical protein
MAAQGGNRSGSSNRRACIAEFHILAPPLASVYAKCYRAGKKRKGAFIVPGAASFTPPISLLRCEKSASIPAESSFGGNMSAGIITEGNLWRLIGLD